jgi:hypothetical protein
MKAKIVLGVELSQSYLVRRRARRKRTWRSANRALIYHLSSIICIANREDGEAREESQA